MLARIEDVSAKGAKGRTVGGESADRKARGDRGARVISMKEGPGDKDYPEVRVTQAPLEDTQAVPEIPSSAH